MIRFAPRRFIFALGFALSLPLAASAQERPLGSAPETGDAKDLFGDCPRDLLRQAWTEMHPLQTGAVEIEVLTFCTGRAEAIRRLLQEQDQLGETIVALKGRAQQTQDIFADRSAADPGALAEDARIASNSAETDDLKARIARLEAGPDTAETRLTLDRLRTELAQKEVQPGRPEATLEVIVRQGTAADPAEDQPAQDGTPISDALSDAMEDRSATDRLAVAETAPVVDSEPAQMDRIVSALASMPGIPPAQTPVELPPDRPTQWQVIHAVRKGDAPWSVLFHGTREVAFSVPGPTPEDPPVISWQTLTEPPVTLGVGETLSDGSILTAVTDEGVMLSDPLAPDAEPQMLRFTSDHAPGVLEWRVIDISDAAEGGS